MCTLKIMVEFNSTWEEGLVTTGAQLNLETGEVTDIEVSDEGDEFEGLCSETIEAGGLTATVEADGDNRYFVVDSGELQQFRNWVANVGHRRAVASGGCIGPSPRGNRPEDPEKRDRNQTEQRNLMSKNTKIELMYRDADNYKTSTHVVVQGAITAEQIHAIYSGLEEGMFIIAHQVGLPTPSFQFLGNGTWPDEECDHVWTTLVDFADVEDLAPEPLHTDEEPTVDLTIEQLANAIANAQWDVAAEWERMGRSA